MTFLWEKQAAEKTADLLKKLNPDHLPIVQVGETENSLFCRYLSEFGWEFEKDKKPFCTILFDPEKVTDSACQEAQYLIVICYNAAHIECTLHSLVGERSVLPSFALTARELEEQMQKCGFAEVDQIDVKGNLLAEEEQTDLLYGDTLLRQFVEFFKKNTDPAADSAVLVRGFERQKQCQKQQEQPRPFLTVLTRTQGTRTQELREVLLCLSAQSCRDFEVLIIGHKVRAENRSAIEQLIEETPDYLRSRIHYYPLETGGRTAPLNYGFSLAKGDYIAILDDDDLVMSDWVEQFQKAAQEKPGRLLHAYCVQQAWERLENGYLRAVGSCLPIYCKDFDWSKQFIVNSCPTLCLAFPRYIFQRLNLRFDESLDVMEDWDYIMRVATCCGVQDIPVVTSIYRMWKTGNSLELHGQNMWDDCYQRITEKWNKGPLLMQAGSEAQILTKKVDECQGICRLYLPGENGYTEENSIVQKSEIVGTILDFWFPVDRVLEGRIRLDPLEDGGLAIEGIQLEIEQEEGKTLQLSEKDLYSTGYQYEKWFVFPKPDPQLYFILPEQVKVRKIHFRCHYERILPEPFVNLMLCNEGISSASLSYRGQRTGGQIPGEYKVVGTKLTCRYTAFPQNEKVTELRFCPANRGGIAVQNFTAKVYDETGREVSLAWRNNGFRKGDGDIFLADPAYGATVPEVLLSKVELELTLTGHISQQTADAFVPRWKRGLQRIYSRLHR